MWSVLNDAYREDAHKCAAALDTQPGNRVREIEQAASGMTFTEFCRSLGLVVQLTAPDGRWHRCPTEDHPKRKNGAWKLAVDGRVGWARNWATHSESAMWRPDRQDAVPEFDAAAHRRAWQGHLQKRAEATKAARRFYGACRPLVGGHAYLTSHDLTMAGCFGLRVHNGWMVVPANRSGRLMTVQRISPAGEKRFWPGASVKGASYTIDRRDATITVLCEGLATGLAIYAAMPMARVIVAFDCGNLAHVQVPTGLVVIAADNDRATEERTGKNPGLRAASEAATALGVGIAAPEGIDGSDWCDFRMEHTRARLERKRKFDSEARVRREVDAQIAAAIMRAATFVTRAKVG